MTPFTESITIGDAAGENDSRKDAKSQIYLYKQMGKGNRKNQAGPLLVLHIYFHETYNNTKPINGSTTYIKIFALARPKARGVNLMSALDVSDLIVHAKLVCEGCSSVRLIT